MNWKFHFWILIMHRLLKQKYRKSPCLIKQYMLGGSTCLQDGISSEQSKQTLNNSMSWTGLKVNLKEPEVETCGRRFRRLFLRNSVHVITNSCSQAFISSCSGLCSCRLMDYSALFIQNMFSAEIVHTRKAPRHPPNSTETRAQWKHQ